MERLSAATLYHGEVIRSHSVVCFYDCEARRDWWSMNLSLNFWRVLVV